MKGKTFIHLIRYYLGLDSTDTQVSPAERECLSNLARGKLRAVEIGVYEGATTRVLAESLENSAELYAIDPFFPGSLGFCWSKLIAKHEAEKYRGDVAIKFVEQLSHDAVDHIDGDFDLIFIDGDHSLEGIKRDWADWSCRVREGGIVALHDTSIPVYNPNIANLGSYQYFESEIRHDERFKLVEQVDSLSVLRRK